MFFFVFSSRRYREKDKDPLGLGGGSGAGIGEGIGGLGGGAGGGLGGREPHHNQQQISANHRNYELDLERDHVLPTSAPNAEILKSNSNPTYPNPNRHHGHDRHRHSNSTPYPHGEFLFFYFINLGALFNEVQERTLYQFTHGHFVFFFRLSSLRIIARSRYYDCTQIKTYKCFLHT